MKNINRREFNRVFAAGLASLAIPSVLSSCGTAAAIPAQLRGSAAAKDARQLGIVLGAQTYSFRDRSLDAAISAMQQLGIKSCELWEGHVEPRELQWARNQPPAEAKAKREKLAEWKKTVSMDYFIDIREKLEAADISIQAYNGSIKDAATDEDIDLVFRIARALGTDTVTSSATVSVMKRIDPYARQYGIRCAMHNHAHVSRPNEFSTPETFSRGMEGLSDLIWVNLDIGHFTAANLDPVAYIKENHQKIHSIHVKDRKRDQGENMPFGEGDTPIGEVLRLIRDNKYPIPANIEYEYQGTDTLVEMQKCIDYCKAELNK